MKKDIEWLKETLDVSIKNHKSFPNKTEWNEGYIMGLIDYKDLVDKLNEPEVLSSDWISKNVEYAYFDMLDGSGRLSSATAIIKPEKLRKLLVPKQDITEEQAYDKIAESFPATAKEIESVLEKYYSSMLIEFSEELHESIMRAFDVEATSKTIEALTGMTLEQIAEEARNGGIVPKQELPVIPKFVADWIEEVKPDNSLRVAFEYIAQQKRDNYDDELAFWVEEGNSETFARAWLDGFTVEEEQKYRVLDGNTTLLGRINGLMLTTVEILEYYPEYAPTFDLTEQEIKDYDPRYWAFAKPVEELEE